MQPDPALLEVDIVNMDQPYFRCTQRVPVGKKEDRVIARVVDYLEESAQLVLSKELNGVRTPRPVGWFWLPARSLEL